jgi:hypothetical protein
MTVGGWCSVTAMLGGELSVSFFPRRPSTSIPGVMLSLTRLARGAATLNAYL